MSEQDTYLTEAVLAIQHEMQLALDYIDTVTSQEASELGAAPSLLTIENARLRIPVILETQQETGTVTTESATPARLRLSREALLQLKKRLYTRQGLLIGVDEKLNGRFIKIRVKSPVSLPAEASQSQGDTSGTAAKQPSQVTVIGEIELTLSRVPREIQAPPAKQGTPVPDVKGKTMEQAVKLLQSLGWRFRPRAASADETAAAPKSMLGRVISQEPRAGDTAERSSAVVTFSVALSGLPVEKIDGIGIERGARLVKAGVATVGELSLASTTQVAAVLGVKAGRAQDFVDMATFMSQLMVAGLSDEVAETLVKGARITSMRELESADSVDLYNRCDEAIRKKKVQVPKEFSITQQDVESWIGSAKEYLRERG